MLDKFLKGIKSEIISQIEEVINETAEIAKTKNLNAIDTLVLVNNNINSCIASINDTIHIDDELLTKIAFLKSPFVSAAKKEVALEVSKIIENESSDVTSKINDFMNELKKKGIDLDGTKSDVSEEKIRKSQMIVEPKKEKNIKERQHILKKTEPSRSIYSSCPSDSCGGSSSSCGGGC